MKLVKAIKEGRILPYKPPEEREKEEEDKEEQYFDIWSDEQPRPPNVMHIPAPKTAPPGYDESYNPPPEYLPTEDEKKKWDETEPEEREKEYLPQKYDSLRRTPAYSNLVKERFERCLDLYLAPRVRKSRLNIDPTSLLPKLPRPEELRPFPTVASIELVDTKAGSDQYPLTPLDNGLQVVVTMVPCEYGASQTASSNGR